jgi:plastocyanin
MTERNRTPDPGRTDPAPDAGTRPSEDRAAGTHDRHTRRRLLAALGAACVPTVAGCSGGGSTAETPTAEPTGTATTATDAMTPNSTATAATTTEDDPPAATTAAAADDVHPRFGFVGTRGTSPPVEPDHAVELHTRPRENVPIPEFFFEPTGLAVEVGDTVRFDLATPHHNVNAYHPAFGYTQRVPPEAPPYSSPILSAGEYWLYTFDTEGVHDLLCAPHELFGMVGTVVVGSPTGPAANPVGEAPGGERARPPEFTAALVLSDPALAPGTVAEEGSVAWDDLAPESKRPLLRPVEGGGEG